MHPNLTTLFDKLSLFSNLTPAEREELLETSRLQDFKKGTPIFHHGTPVSSFYIIADGAVRLYRETPEGKEITLTIAILGDMLGDHELFENKPTYQAHAVAAEDCLLLTYNSNWIKKKVQEHSSLTLNMLAAISKKGSRSTIDREQLVTMKTPQRIGCFLLHLCDVFNLNPKSFVLPYSKATIASKLGMEPESFSRALGKLKDIGVTVQGNNVSIADSSTLERFVCRSCSTAEDCKTCHIYQINR